MQFQPLKLLSETPVTEGVDFLIEEKNKSGPSNMFIKGPYIVAEEVNRNNRMYSINEVAEEIKRYQTEIIDKQRALGELEHPNNAQVSSERACHLITELKQDGNIFIGKSRVLNTPMGLIVKSLITDGVKLGVSTRALGKLNEVNGYNRVSGFRLITVDVVADPSANAFVEGILESKQYVLNADGTLEEYYDRLENAISTLPRRDVDIYLRQRVLEFINNLKR